MKFVRIRAIVGALPRICLGFGIAWILVASAWANGSDTARDYDLPAANLAQSVNAISQRSGVQIVYKTGLLKNAKAGPVSGHLTVRQALDKALAGSGLVYKFIDNGTIVIRRAPSAGKASPGAANSGKPSGENAASEKPTSLNTVSVTGTRIRGGTTPSPTITIDQAQMKEQGFTDLGEVIRSISQNFRGGQNPGIALGASAGGIANQNISGGSALNLRGLGPDATLTLLNGRRLSYDGFVQAVDISAIPLEAVDRIEVVPDGASAIYGSDAVAGVANVVLKPDFEGATIGARFGAAADGGLVTRDYTATTGGNWNSGGLIVTLKKEIQDPIYADQRDYTQSMDDPTTIYSGHDLRSGLLSFNQALGDIAELRLDALQTTRNVPGKFAYPGFYYSEPFSPTVSLIAPSVAFYVPGDWTITASFTRGRDEDDYKDYYVTPDSSELDAVGCYCNKSKSWEADAEGPLVHFGSNEIRLATGVGSRTNDFLIHSYISGTREGGSERSNFVYGELAVPLVSQQNARPGVHRLELSLAARGEDYSSFGRVTTPKVGIIYDPTTNFTLKTSWGRSFKAPTLLQRYENRISYLWNATQLGGTGLPDGSTVLMSYGGNSNLKPERARTWTTSLAFHPESMPGLDAELSYFRIDYTDRVAQPLIYLAKTLSDPAYAQFVSYSPTEQEQQQLLAAYGDAFYNYAGADYDPSKVVAIAQDQYINVGRQRAKGVDLTGTYRIDLGLGELQIRGSASWLESTQQNGADATPVQLAGTIFHPAKWNSRVGAVWESGGFTASGFVNYTQGVTSNLTAVTEQIGSFTTVDTTLRYETQAENRLLSGVVVSLSVQNLFDRPPPLFTPPYPSYAPFDSTNYSAIGRFTSVSVAKHW